MPSSGFRKLTIALIVVAIVVHPACGFTIHRSKTSTDAEPAPSTDLALEESIQLQVNNDLKSPNDIKKIKYDDLNKDTLTKNKYKLNSEAQFTNSTAENATNNVTETESIPNTSVPDVSTNTIDVTTESTGTTGSESDPTDQVIKHPVRNKTTSTGSTNTSKDVPLQSFPENNTTTKLIRNHSENTRAQNIKEPETAPELENITAVSISRKQTEASTTEKLTINDQIAIDSEATENLTAHKNLKNHTKLVQNESKYIDSIVNDTEMSSMKTSDSPITTETNEKQDNTSVKQAANVSSFNAAYTTSQSFEQVKSSELADEDSLKSALTNAGVVSTDASTEPVTEPSWKKYITIERKRGTSSEEATSTEKDKDLVNAESNQTTLSVPSEEMSEEALLSNVYQPSIQTGNVTAETEIMPTLGSIESTQSETLGTVASKRAGFLDLSKRTSTRVETNTASSEKQPDMYRTLYEIEATDIEAQEIKKIDGHESESQLAEDAMKEELMKEEMLNNHVENAKRYEEGKNDEVKPLEDDARSADSSTSQSIAEENLSVQPINQDRRTTLYTVGPNYKPMKRIEVQPAKPFVRDPDDNSWRNESISSLGIVFKPKNSSLKSFKEVLKTKTETEFNNLQDRDNRDETPELRARLEKIAEVRKSKKKRIDKFGEVVYTDYEEGGSAEGTSTAKADGASTGLTSEIFSTLSSEVPNVEVTSPMTPTTEGQRYWKNKLETISKQEMFKELGLDILTTEKPKKTYNIAEYYDTTDEYDADYAALSKMDLKKFTLPSKTTYSPLTSPPMPHTSRFATPRFPDRRPTIQYFPPTSKPQKVNVNDYDVDFERRVRLYTLKESPTTAPHHADESAPVATDRPDLGPTAKPSDFTELTPDDSPDERVYATRPRNFIVDGHFDRGSYVIKHYGDFPREAAEDTDDSELVPYTPPPRGLTLDEFGSAGKTTEADYEYDTRFRKEVLGRFVDNFNRHSDRFKVEFPVLFNSSVAHGAAASSSASVKRLYGVEGVEGVEGRGDVTVELSPAYELHYYVPDQEEREVAEPRTAAALPAQRYAL